MSEAIFIANKASGILKIEDKREIDRAIWRKPRGNNRSGYSSASVKQKFQSIRDCRA